MEDQQTQRMFKLPDGKYADGSWELNVYVTDLQAKRTLRVTGDKHIGGVMLNLVEDLDVAIDWSDHALWWPEKNKWLTRTRSTLDQEAIQADAQLHFTPMHKTLRVQMPDLQMVDMRVDFSIKSFNAVMHVCRELGIRHPEELSFLKRPPPSSRRNSKVNGSAQKKKKNKDRDSMASSSSLDDRGSQGSMDGLGTSSPHAGSPSPYHRPPNTPGSSNWTPGSYSQYPLTPNNQGFNQTILTVHSDITDSDYPTMPRTPKHHLDTTATSSFNGRSPNSIHSMISTSSYGSDLSPVNGNSTSLVVSPAPTQEALDSICRPRSLKEKAYINAGWLDSSKSLMEQDLRENDTVLLRFKYFAFYDLDPKQDSVRINQIYEQARWMILNEELECTEEECIMFAALQLQANLQSQVPQNYTETTNNGDDIDAALNELQVSLEGTSNSSQNNITTVPELADYLRFFKPKKFTLKSFKRYWFVLRDTHLTYYRSQEEMGDPIQTCNLKGCEVTPDVNTSNGKYGIKLLVATQEGMTEIWLRTEHEGQYAKWMAAFRLASRGKTMADSSYQPEVQSILAFLNMQQRRVAAEPIKAELMDIKPDDFVSSKWLKKFKAKQIASRILEAQSNMRDMSLLEAKQSFIKAWQALPEYGITYFTVKFRNSKKEELIGICYNRVMKMDINCGDSLKTWRYNAMTAWHVNWEVREVLIQTEEENVQFACTSCDCKIVHEFIGGYIFLAMRSKDQNQTLDETMFHKLTGGWI